MKTTARSSRSRIAARERNLCQFTFGDGRRCRMLRLANHPCLCVFHARAEAQALEAERLGMELAQTMSGDFMSATDINFAMGRLYAAVAEERIAVRNANTLARIGRLLLHTVPVIKKEFPFNYTFDQWNQMLNRSKPLSQRSPGASSSSCRGGLQFNPSPEVPGSSAPCGAGLQPGAFPNPEPALAVDAAAAESSEQSKVEKK